MEALSRLYDGRKIIVGRDKLDPTKGVLPKVGTAPDATAPIADRSSSQLRAFEEFLRRFPEWRGKVVLVQVTTPSPTDSVHLAAKISELVDHINATYGSLQYQPVHHYHQNIERDVSAAGIAGYAVLRLTQARAGVLRPFVGRVLGDDHQRARWNEHHLNGVHNLSGIGWR